MIDVDQKRIIYDKCRSCGQNANYWYIILL